MKNEKKIHLTNPIIKGYNSVLDKENYRDEKIKNICRALLMYNESNDINKIIEVTGISRRSFFNYKKNYFKDPYFMLRERESTNNSILDKYVNKISDDFKQTHIKTYKQAQKRIEEITGIKRSETQIRNFLIKRGFKKNKNGNYNQRPTGKTIITNIKNTCLYLKRDEVERFIDRTCPGSPKIMVRKLKEKYPELAIFNDEYILEHTHSISPF